VQRVDHGVDVGELVIEERSTHAFGELCSHVADLLARLVPRGVQRGLRRAALHPQREPAIALPGEAAHVVDVLDLLQLPLHAVEHLILHLSCAGAGPGDDGRHRRHVENRVFQAPELRERPAAHQQRGQHQEQHQRPVRDGPLGQVE
jgi:hypothetical protein